MCNHLNLKILIHIFTVIYLIMIIIIMRGKNFVAQRLCITDLPYKLLQRTSHGIRHYQVSLPLESSVLRKLIAPDMAIAWKHYCGM
jgi:hypothetical protein